ncbi:transmembrane emp24 domain-containing protein 2-like [Sphaerodactylus townsendi]|uniref:Uncharacterized protein n=1 Tax=Sphaerodactylus townsendi TaxID=933632 RepID=A0ACB8FZA0_9SAUR|nr:transmembrane emp24 domain-containing protein 2-like [Sphaerodactylus townsendi]
MSPVRPVLVLLAALSASATATERLFFIDPLSEECFRERVPVRAEVAGAFVVIEGGFLDVDVEVTGPDNKVIYSGERETEGKYNFVAYMDGIYKFCFGNKMSTMVQKAVTFTLDIHEAPKSEDTETEETKWGLVEVLGLLASMLYRAFQYLSASEEEQP